MKNKEEKIVRLIAVDNRYIVEPYPAMAAWDEQKHCYLTGQHIDPNESQTRGNLTVAEMTGEKMLSEDKAWKFPYVINPLNKIPLVHMDRLNITKDEKGIPIDANAWAKYVYVMCYCPIVAPNKSAINPGMHYFYMEDLESEAEEEVNIEDLIYEAQKCIREKTSIRNYNDIALMLTYKIKNFSIVPETMSEVRVKKALLDACKAHYKEVVSCFQEDAKEELYIFKLLKYAIIELRNGAYFDGNTLIGTSIEGVKVYIKTNKPDNIKFNAKWGKLLLEKEGKLPATEKSSALAYTMPDFVTIEGGEKGFIISATFEELQDYAGKGKKYKGADWKELGDEDLRLFLIQKLESKKV